MRRPVRGVVAVLVLLVAGGPAAAQPDPVARKTYDAGVSAYENGRYEEAVRRFEETLRVAPTPNVVFSLAQSYRRAYAADPKPARLERAIELFRRYVAEVRGGPMRATAVRALEDLETRRALLRRGRARPAEATLQVTSKTPGTRVAVDGGRPATLPFVGKVASGPHLLQIEAPGCHPEERNITVADGSVLTIDVALVARSASLLVDAPAGADVTVDGRFGGQGKVTLSLPAGEHIVTVTQRGRRPRTERVRLAGGETRRLGMDLRASLQRKIAWGALASGGALLAGGALASKLALDAQGKALDVERSAGMLTDPGRSRHEDLVRDRDRYRFVAGLGLSAGAALAVTGALLYWFDEPSSVERPVSVVLGPASLELGVRF